jgi:hypothetical protein
MEAIRKANGLAIESAIDEASKSIEKYKKNTYKELKHRIPFFETKV